MKWSVRIPFSVATLALVAIQGPSCGGGGSGQCDTDSDCSSGQRCNQGQCMTYEGPGFLCSASNPCPKGQFCFNGVCALGCNTDQDCADNQYCDTRGEHLCAKGGVPTCPDTPCPSNQVCMKGFCSAKVEDQTCTPRPDGQDGCDDHSLCIDTSESDSDEEKLACVSFPPCPEDGVCPVGTTGAVCNDGYIPNKARMCLTGLCKDDSNCPSGFECITPDGSVLGMCGNGAFGAPCLSNEDCNSGLSCVSAGSGIPGSCMPGGGPGGTCEEAGGTCVGAASGGCPAGTTPDASKSCDGMTEICCL